MTLPRAFFSKCPAAREAFIRSWLAGHTGRTALHLHPKNLRRTPYADPASRAGAPGVVRAAYEDVTKTEVWLRINSLIADDTLLILENPSRYPKITSEKVKFLRRLSMRLRGERIVTDIVPFTLSREYLYTPYSYLGREILGYPHWYAFRENYQEIADDGRVVHALDFDVLARKAAAVSAIDYEAFLAPDRETIRFEETADEKGAYAAKKEALFARYEGEDGLRMAEGGGPPQKIVTRLADGAHALESRRRCLADVARRLIAETGGPVIAVCNLQSYAKEAERVVSAAGVGWGGRFRATSYQVGAEREDWSAVRGVIFAEAPIINSHYRLDIEAALPEGCRVYSLLGTTGVDRYLTELIEDETGQIDEFTRALSAECERRNHASL